MKAAPITPAGVDFALDVAGSGVLRELVALTGAPEHVITVADLPGAQQTGESARRRLALPLEGRQRDLAPSGPSPVGQALALAHPHVMIEATSYSRLR